MMRDLEIFLKGLNRFIILPVNRKIDEDYVSHKILLNEVIQSIKFYGTQVSRGNCQYLLILGLWLVCSVRNNEYFSKFANLSYLEHMNFTVGPVKYHIFTLYTIKWKLRTTVKTFVD